MPYRDSVHRRTIPGCLAIAICALMLMPIAAWGAIVWKSYTAPGPGPRKGHGMVYDAARKRIVLFGGKTSAGVYLDDTWEFDVLTRTWSDRTVGHSPKARAYFAMTYDPVRARTILQGGQQSANAGDAEYLSPSTWEWDGLKWLRISSSESPEWRWHNRMVWDVERQEVVLFGGANGSDTPMSDTWIFRNGGWSQKTPASVPQERMAHAMTYDSWRQRVLMHGGAHVHFGHEPSSQHVFAWAANAWTLLTGGGPLHRSGHTMVFDDRRGVAVLFGGTYENVIYGDTWELNDSTWSQKSNSGAPAPRFNHAMAYDSFNHVVWMFGGEGYAGLADTQMWAYGEVADAFDLRLYFVRAEPPQIVEPGSKTAIEVRFRNVSGTPVASSLAYRIWLSLDQELDGLDTRICNRELRFVVNPNRVVQLTPTCRIPEDMPEGSYFLIAMIESPGDTRTANNLVVSRSKLLIQKD